MDFVIGHIAVIQRVSITKFILFIYSARNEVARLIWQPHYQIYLKKTSECTSNLPKD
jgi:hypothetical protein